MRSFSFGFGAGDTRSLIPAVAVPPMAEPQLTTYAADLDLGRVLAKPSEDGSWGPYIPQLLGPEIIPASWTAVGIERVAIWSTDHDGGGGGIYYGVRKGGAWKNWTEAVAAGWLTGITIPYTTNPLIKSDRQNPAGFTQIESPWIIKVGSTYVMTYQVNNLGIATYRNAQGTVRATSTDMINWTVPTSRTLAATLLLNSPLNGIIGDGHTGYFKCWANPFPDFKNPATGLPWAYVGYSLCGGSTKSTTSQWGSDDPVAGTWTQTSGGHGFSGRFLDFPEYHAGSGLPAMRLQFYTFDLANVRAIGDGTFSVLGSCFEAGSGGDRRYSAIVECILDSKGQRILGVASAPVKLPNVGNALAFDGKGSSAATVYRDGDRFELLYQAESESGGNSIGEIRGPWADPADTVFKPFSPDLEAHGAHPTWDFTSLTAIPSALQLNLFGSPVAQNTGFTANGWAVSPRAGAALTSEPAIFHSAGFIPAEMEAVEWWVTGHESTSGTGAFRDIFMGFATQKGVQFASQTDALLISNKQDTATATSGSILYKRVIKGGVNTPVASTLYYGLGQASTHNAYRRSFGVRMLPQQRRMILVGECGADLEEWAIPEEWDLSVRLYPFLAYRANSTTVNAFERIKTLTYRANPV